MSADNTPTPAWRVADSALGRVEISRQDGAYLLVVELNDGGQWQADATEAVRAAAAHETEVLRKELDIALRAIDRGDVEHTAAKVRISELEEEIEFARGMLGAAVARGFLDELGQGG